MSTVQAGSRLGPYEILQLLGTGGMGEVYRARDCRLGRDVAIKVLPSRMACDPSRLKRFEHEARATAALNQPNILALYDTGTHDGRPFLVSELLNGESLRIRLDAGRLPIRKAVDYARQVAVGLAAAHAKGIVHRDIKPENLFLTTDERVKILDFGVAKLTVAGEMTSATLTHSGTMVGTVGYMAPEQVCGQPADARSDIFSLGAVLYEMLAGRRAFRGESSVDTVTAILTKDPPPLSAHTSELPTGLDAIVGRCLEKAPEQRFQTATDLAFALEAIGSDTSPEAPNRVPRIAARHSSLRRWLVSAGLIVPAVSLVAGIWLSPAFRPFGRLLGFAGGARGSTQARRSTQRACENGTYQELGGYNKWRFTFIGDGLSARRFDDCCWATFRKDGVKWAGRMMCSNDEAYPGLVLFPNDDCTLITSSVWWLNFER